MDKGKDEVGDERNYEGSKKEKASERFQIRSLQNLEEVDEYISSACGQRFPLKQ